jgi:hypothetical protein
MFRECRGPSQSKEDQNRVELAAADPPGTPLMPFSQLRERCKLGTIFLLLPPPNRYAPGMPKPLRDVIKSSMPTPLRNTIKDVTDPVSSRIRYKRWEAAGRPLPAPNLVKREIIRSYARDFSLDVLVETGTYYADKVRALRKDFRQIYSIELDQRLYSMAVARCKRQENAILIQGDSGERIVEVVTRLAGPALFWLDAHYSAGETARGEVNTPIHAELTAVLGDNRRHVVLVDDMREFVHNAEDYPALDAVQQIADDHDYIMTTALDVIRLTPQ